MKGSICSENGKKILKIPRVMRGVFCTFPSTGAPRTPPWMPMTHRSIAPSMPRDGAWDWSVRRWGRPGELPVGNHRETRGWDCTPSGGWAGRMCGVGRRSGWADRSTPNTSRHTSCKFEMRIFRAYGRLIAWLILKLHSNNSFQRLIDWLE